VGNLSGPGPVPGLARRRGLTAAPGVDVNQRRRHLDISDHALIAAGKGSAEMKTGYDAGRVSRRRFLANTGKGLALAGLAPALSAL
jgi:hypothetical protein